MVITRAVLILLRAANFSWKVKISEKLYNTIRKAIRNALQYTLRPYSDYPLAGAKAKNRVSIQNNEAVVEFNRFGYNPTLERRVSYRLRPIAEDSKKQQIYCNIYYMVI